MIIEVKRSINGLKLGLLCINIR